MRLPNRTRIAVIAAGAIAAFAWVRPSLTAAPPVMTPGGLAKEPAPDPVPRVYFPAPMTADAAKVWIKLQQKVAMKFGAEVPLQEVLRSVREATKGDEMPDGLAIYVDPVGLTEAEMTMASPITIDLDSIRLETGLKLALKQLDLTFNVHPDGLVVITSANSPDVQSDASAIILDKLDALQKEVAKLRTELGHGPAKE